MFCNRCKKTQQWILRPQPQEYAVVIPTKFNDLHGWAECVDRFIWVVEQTNEMYSVPLGVMVGQAELVWEDAASGDINCLWHVNSHVDLDMYWSV